MDDQSKHIRFFTGSLIQIQRLQLDLDENKIPSLVKNNFESGLRIRFLWWFYFTGSTIYF